MTGLFGGTFDPFHLAHRALAEHALKQLDLRQLIVMPVGRPPHKEGRISFAAYRYEMACLGMNGIRDVLVSDDEIRTPGVDYTYHTVLRLKKKYGLKELVLLSGSDLLGSLDSWYRPADLLKEVSLAVAIRGNDNRQSVAEQAETASRRYGTSVRVFDMPAMDLSASLIRARIASGEDIDGLCPDQVVRFIRRYRPYASREAFDRLNGQDWQDLLNLEERAWPYLSRERRLHSVSVAQYAARLAALMGEDIKMAASAGLLHDLAKELPARQKEELALSYFDRHGQRPSSDFLKGELAHGPASAIMASRLTGMENDPLVHAIAWHSTGHPDMTVLGGILFLADKIAYDREFGELREIRALAESGNLAGAMKACFEEVFKALARQGKSPCELSIQAYKKYSEMG
ncbi:MAG TPA: nicotinate (nicotinamide) nucleotide adenylyltransferase [Bacillota bacterium]|nr:nicotinate (nicotinamide) nucleotide adenylyltransferase [Fastidiosipila sp.]HPX93891.1 nicotinate (nicotinamide) nucleotide adenylyltransferase [Bacillota bacterium]HQB81787.1 nicotinate (nicotinamide) nucleotide adenylyltransferase [Bacillota bacterium]